MYTNVPRRSGAHWIHFAPPDPPIRQWSLYDLPALCVLDSRKNQRDAPATQSPTSVTALLTTQLTQRHTRRP
ncbi:hypothetical protein FRC07_010839, partial [Ceratobasidium sp. 392]